MQPSPEQQREMLRLMQTIRRFEERATQDYLNGDIYGVVHSYIGEEAVAVGVCSALEEGDRIVSTHRGHGHCIAKGADLDRMMAELYGRETGYCKGKGGSMHIADQANGNLGANAIVGGSAGIATGAALTAKRLGKKEVSVCFFGDGALGQGLLYETMNMAALWKLPIIYACENNLYGEYTKVEEMAAGVLKARAKGFGIESFEVDGQDVLAVNNLTQELVERARKGDGPFFMLLNTYRYHGHHVGDINREYYRSKEEEQLWRDERDPIKNLSILLIDKKISTSEELKSIELEIEKDAEEAVDYALNAAWPEASEVNMHVFAAN